MPRSVRAGAAARGAVGSLVLIRDGESAVSAAGCLAGRLDVPLSAAGLAEAREGASRVVGAGLMPDVVATSPMVRARQTTGVLLESFGAHGLVVEVVPQLVDRDLGALTGMAAAAVLERLGPDRYWAVLHALDAFAPVAAGDWPAGAACYHDKDAGVSPQGQAESLRGVVDRLRRWWLVARGRVVAGQTVVVVLGLGTGFLGGFPTFSALALEVERLAAAGLPLLGVTYGAVSVLLGVGCAMGGVWWGARWERRREAVQATSPDAAPVDVRASDDRGPG